MHNSVQPSDSEKGRFGRWRFGALELWIMIIVRASPPMPWTGPNWSVWCGG
jgi:hypothetical protein